MEEEQLPKIWKSFSQTKAIQVDTTKLKNDMDSNIKTAEKRANRRDNREIIGAIIAIIIFASLAIKHNTAIVWLAFVFCLAAMVYVIQRLRKSKKKLPDNFLSLSVLEQLAIEKEYVLKQQHLLQTATYWYAMPLFFVQVFFIFSMVVSKEGSLTALASISVGKTLLLAVLVFLLLILSLFISKMNRKAAKKNWAPIVKEIEALEKELNN